MEHIERPHPLGVTFCKVVIDCYYVHAFVCHSVEEDWQGCHQGFTLTSSHLGNFTFVEHYATDELHIVVYHIPYVLVATSSPAIGVDGFVAIDFHEVEAAIGSQVAIHLGSGDYDLLVLCKTTSSTLDDSEYLWQYLAEYVLVCCFDVFFYVVYFVIYFFTFVNFEFFDIGFELSDACFLVSHALLDAAHEGSTAGTEGIVVQRVYLIEYDFDFLYIRHDFAHIFLRLIAE